MCYNKARVHCFCLSVGLFPFFDKRPGMFIIRSAVFQICDKSDIQLVTCIVSVSATCMGITTVHIIHNQQCLCISLHYTREKNQVSKVNHAFAPHTV